MMPKSVQVGQALSGWMKIKCTWPAPQQWGLTCPGVNTWAVNYLSFGEMSTSQEMVTSQRWEKIKFTINETCNSTCSRFMSFASLQGRKFPWRHWWGYHPWFRIVCLLMQWVIEWGSWESSWDHRGTWGWDQPAQKRDELGWEKTRSNTETNLQPLNPAYLPLSFPVKWGKHVLFSLVWVD